MLVKVDTFDDLIEVEAIAYSWTEDIGTVRHKFGTRQFVMDWAEKTRKEYVAHEDPIINEMGRNIEVIEIDNLPKEEVEKMINICDYIGRFLEKHKMESISLPKIPPKPMAVEEDIDKYIPSWGSSNE